MNKQLWINRLIRGMLIILISWSLALMLGSAFAVYTLKQLHPIFPAEYESLRPQFLGLAALNVATFGTLTIFVLLTQRYARQGHQWLKGSHNWHVDAVNKALALLDDRIKHVEIGLQPSPAEPSQDRWPWGSHHTDLLGHLEAAARRHWVLYDPTDSSTAPTNETVSTWLHKERGVSKDKAQAIASILRADGLKTGPRM